MSLKKNCLFCLCLGQYVVLEIPATSTFSNFYFCCANSANLMCFAIYQVVLMVKNPSANKGDIRNVCLIPGLGRSPEGRHGNPFQYCLENPMDRGAWLAAHDSQGCKVLDMTEETAHTHSLLQSVISANLWFHLGCLWITNDDDNK